MNIIHMKQADKKELREKLWLLNNKKCPLLQIEVPESSLALDHIHKLKNEEYSEQKGTIRNAIDNRANMLEGKISNAWKRYYGSNIEKHPISLPNFLRNLADYLEAGAYQSKEGNFYLHPDEVPKESKLKKSSYNKLKKVYQDNKVFPEYPKSGKLIKSLKLLYTKYQIEPEFY